MQDMGTAEVLRVGDFASFLGADPNQVTSVFDMLALADVLRREDMIECPYCGMVALCSDFEAALDEDDEFRCSDCDRPLTRTAVRTVATYRRGEKWKETPRLQKTYDPADLVGPSPALAASNVGLDEHAWYTHVRLAEVYAVGKDALRKRLDNYRANTLDGWKENEDRRPREPKYLYQLLRVKHIIAAMQTSSERPAK
jgi:hypothetical protein